MRSDDPLIRLLHAADAAVDVSSVAAELPERVRRRRAAKAARLRRTAAATVAVAAVLLASVWVRNGFRSASDRPASDSQVARATTAAPNHPVRLAADAEKIAQLRAEAEALTAEADALQNAITQRQGQLRVAELAEQYKNLLGDAVELDPAQLAVDRAAAVALCQGDFLWQELEARDAAAEAYHSVVKHFPQSRWAAIARDNLNRLQMN